MTLYDTLSDSDYIRLGEFFAQYPQVCLDLYGHGEFKNLDFLQHMPQLQRLHIRDYFIEDITGLEAVTTELRYFGFEKTKSKKPNLQQLKACNKLEELYLEGHNKGFESIAELTALCWLSLRSMKLESLDLLRGLKNIWSFELKLGGTTNLDALAELPLKYLELWQVRGLENLDPIGEIRTLQYLFLQSLKHVNKLPSFEKLEQLRRVHLELMPGIRDLSPLQHATALDTLLVLDARHMQSDDFKVLVGHPTLTRIAAGLGSEKKNKAVGRLLPLDVPESRYLFKYK